MSNSPDPTTNSETKIWKFHDCFDRLEPVLQVCFLNFLCHYVKKHENSRFFVSVLVFGSGEQDDIAYRFQ